MDNQCVGFTMVMTDLHALHLDATSCTDVAVLIGSVLPKLCRLHMAGTRITDHALRVLSKRCSLTDLSLSGCPDISDEGVALLHTQQRLQRLDLSGCPQLSPAALARLTHSLAPTCQFGLPPPLPPPPMRILRASEATSQCGARMASSGRGDGTGSGAAYGVANFADALPRVPAPLASTPPSLGVGVEHAGGGGANPWATAGSCSFAGGIVGGIGSNGGGIWSGGGSRAVAVGSGTIGGGVGGLSAGGGSAAIGQALSWGSGNAIGSWSLGSDASWGGGGCESGSCGSIASIAAPDPRLSVAATGGAGVGGGALHATMRSHGGGMGLAAGVCGFGAIGANGDGFGRLAIADGDGSSCGTGGGGGACGSAFGQPFEPPQRQNQ